ncbi:unnamed protein product [Sphenostylis stenocarpa]|uniref:Pentatricopeptide repeat-containing protein n=1 Tax=Sphenostylis stenocarpa TaxID=92480 RepID=A0AA86SWE9_9FABA|nr:unnamed protein product [Sphenostylis stenocarpa]
MYILMLETFMKQKNFSRPGRAKVVCLNLSQIFPLSKLYTKSWNYCKVGGTLHAMQSKGISPSCVHFNVLLHGFTKPGLIDEAKRIYEELPSFALAPDLVCYLTMLNTPEMWICGRRNEYFWNYT